MTLEMELEPLAGVQSDVRTSTLEPTQGTDARPRLGCSVGIMAYNEEGNIANAIKTVLEQPLTSGEIAEVIVVASGCTDRTTEIVASLAEHEPRLRLIVEEQRAGKASAINQFIAASRSPVLVLVNADTMVRNGTIDALVQHFHDPTVGMVGGHPIPVNDDDHFLGYAVHLLWRLHDQIARESPKLGEIVAFRNVFPSIPTDTAVDELSMQALVTQLGLRLVYEPQAIVYMRGPTTVVDFLRQRRRICAGHLRIAKQEGYVASTMSTRRIGRAVLASDCFKTPNGQPLWTVGTVTLEATARALGYYDFLRQRPHHIWTAVATTKGDIDRGQSAGRTQNVLVFHVVDSAEDRLALGALATRSVLRRAAQDIRARLGSRATVSEQANGTIIVMLPGDRADAENIARELVRDLAARPLGTARRGGQPVQLACAIVTFPETGSPLAGSLPALAS
ncbi:MAG: poly-beta,6-N-acetyl-D-glucosamine synthase [Actinomycetota bacterium]|nr:poly-beta,6-N-acetyl-D-glucosamine synthase [Actinomycetota bacterium]